MVTYEGERANTDRTLTNPTDPVEEGWENHLRLGQDVRLVLAAVGGGAVRVAREVARRHIRHLETIAINCDPKVAGFEEFDDRIYLGPDSGADRDTGGSAYVGGLLARAAEPTLQRAFRGATFVVVLGSLGGGAGSGALPHVLDVASRNAEVVSAFVIKPFRCEGDRRALAERAIGRLHLVESFAEKRENGCASLQVLDNETLIPRFGRTAFNELPRHWARLLEDHLESAFLAPVEALLGATQMVRLAHTASIVEPAIASGPPALAVPPAPSVGEPGLPPLLPAARAESEAELTFEVVTEVRPPTLP